MYPSPPASTLPSQTHVGYIGDVPVSGVPAKAAPPLHPASPSREPALVFGPQSNHLNLQLQRVLFLFPWPLVKLTFAVLSCRVSRRIP